MIQFRRLVTQLWYIRNIFIYFFYLHRTKCIWRIKSYCYSCDMILNAGMEHKKLRFQLLCVYLPTYLADFFTHLIKINQNIGVQRIHVKYVSYFIN